MSHIDCAARADEVRRWFESLPEGVAEMEVSTTHEYYEVVVTIRPLREPKAARFEIGFYADSFDVWMGRNGSGFKENSCREDSPVDYCTAITTGSLTETVYLRKGEQVNLRQELRMNDDTLVYNDFGGCGCSLMPSRWLLRWDEERSTHYPPYYEHG